MKNTPNNPIDRDTLLTRVVDGCATPDDWHLFRKLAAADHAVWSELSETHHLQSELESELDAAIACADRVDLPAPPADTTTFQRRLDGLAKWGGWVAAAAILIAAFAGRGLFTGAPPNNNGHAAGIAPINLTPDQALSHYLDRGKSSGRVIGQVPDRVVLETIPTDDGRMEVVYLRQIIERRFVNEVLTRSWDETGNPIEIPARIIPARAGSF